MTQQEGSALLRHSVTSSLRHTVEAFLDATGQAQQQWLAEGMPVSVIADAGHTVLVAGTITCLGVGPAADPAVDAITGELKLVR